MERRAAEGFTCLVPCYNASATILDTVNSLLGQTHSDLQIIILDNGSTDDTLAKLGTILDRRLRVICYPHVPELSASLNRCFNEDLISSKYFSICHADDVYDPKFVKSAIDVLRKCRSSTIVFSLARKIDEKGNDIFSFYFFLKNLINTLFPKYIGTYGVIRVLVWNTLFAPSAVFRRSDISKYSKFGSKLKLFTDVYFWCNWMLRGGQILVLRRRLLSSRVHGNQQSSFVRGKPSQFTEISTLKEKLISELGDVNSTHIRRALALHIRVRILYSALLTGVK